jgi:hypothetical protein
MAQQRPATFDVISVDQKESVGLSPVPSPLAAVNYLYRPSYESVSEGVEGQDYLVLGTGPHAIVFALCDGVSQSFFGQLAARFLGDALLTWLAALEPLADEKTLAARLTAFLADQTGPARRQVDAYSLPDDLPPLVRSAWEDQRAYGSETMFVCGRLQFPPDRPGRCLLCWLGDTEAQVFDRDGTPLDLGASWSSDERWSTHHGVRGAETVHTWLGSLDRIDQVIVYTDGLHALKDRLRPLLADPADLQHHIDRIYHTPEGDDISLLAISPRRLVAPHLLEIDNPWLLGSYILRWQAVPGAEAYLVEESSHPRFDRDLVSWISQETRARLRGQPRGRYYYRVRALAAGLQSEPSNVRATRTLLPL